MKKTFGIFLVILIISNHLVTHCVASEGNCEEDSCYMTDQYYEDVYSQYSFFMENTWSDYLTNDKKMAYVQFINKAEDNGYFQFCISSVETLTNASWSNFFQGTFDESDVKVQYYVSALSSLLMTMECNLSDVIATHAEADATMRWKNYMEEGLSVVTSIASKGGGSIGGIEGMGFEMAFDVCGVSIDAILNEIDTLDALQALEAEADKYLMYHTFLETIKGNTSDPLLRQASDYLLNATDLCFSYMMNIFQDGVLNAETDCFFDVLDEVIEQLEKENMVIEEWAALKFLSNVADNVSSFQLGVDIGMFAGDIFLNSSDTILRYYEMKTMVSAREALIAEIKKQDDNIKNVGDWESISLVRDLLFDLLYVNMRGEYCLYSLLTEDLGILNVMFPAGEDTESWFNTMLEISFIIQSSIDDIFPSWDNYIKEETTDAWNIAVNAYGDILDMFYYKILGGWDYSEDVSYLFSWSYSPVHSLSDAGYAIMDLDGNGVPELLISPVEDAAEGMIYDLYTCVNGEVMHIASSGERYRYYLSEDYTIYYEGSGGASNSSNIKYTIDADKGSLKLKEVVLYDGEQDEKKPWFYGTDECYDEMTGYDFGRMTHLEGEEAQDIIQSYRVIEFDLTLFDTYSHQEDMPADIFLKRAFQQATEHETEAYFICGDFDGNETVEAFGITGIDDGYDLNDVKIYCVGTDGLVSCIDTKVCLYGYGGIYSGRDTSYMIMDTGNAKFLVLGGIDGQEIWLYGIRNKEVYQPGVSGQHADFGKTEEGLYFAESHEGGEGYYLIYYDYDPTTGEFVVQEAVGN